MVRPKPTPIRWVLRNSVIAFVHTMLICRPRSDDEDSSSGGAAMPAKRRLVTDRHPGRLFLRCDDTLDHGMNGSTRSVLRPSILGRFSRLDPFGGEPSYTSIRSFWIWFLGRIQSNPELPRHSGSPGNIRRVAVFEN